MTTTTLSSSTRQYLSNWNIRTQAWLLLEKRALYGLSATRILVGIAMLGILITNFGNRYVLWGPGSFWAEPLRERSEFGFLLSLFSTDSPLLFTLFYLALIGVAVAVVIGWRTRLMTIALVLGMPALVERADILGNQGDNIARIGLLFMVFMTTNAHWSVDARRRRRRVADNLTPAQKLWWGHPILPDWITTLLHNAALVALACQVFILYTASALYKVQGDLWQAGTALHYPLSLHEYGVFPWLNSMLTTNPFLLTALTYFSVYVQLFFAVALLHPVSRRLVLIGVICLHGGIAVLMGLPWFSLAMLAFDAIFVSSRTYQALQRWVGRRFRGFRSKIGAVPKTGSARQPEALGAAEPLDATDPEAREKPRAKVK